MLVDRGEEVGQHLVKFRLVFHKGWEGTCDPQDTRFCHSPFIARITTVIK